MQVDEEDEIVCATIGISVLIFAGSIIGSNLFVFITGTFFGLLCGIKYIYAEKHHQNCLHGANYFVT